MEDNKMSIKEEGNISIEETRTLPRFDLITSGLGEDLNKAVLSYYALGQAVVIACLTDWIDDTSIKEVTIEDVKDYFKLMMDGDSLIKEYANKYIEDLKEESSKEEISDNE